MCNLFSSTVLAARNGDGSWIVPLVVFAIWVGGAILKAIGESRQAKKDQQRIKELASKKKPTRTTQADIFRDKEPLNPPKPQKRPGAVSQLKTAMQKALEEAYAEQQKKTKPIPARQVPAKAVSRSRTQKRYVPEPEKIKPRPVTVAKRKPVEKSAEPVELFVEGFNGDRIIDSLRDQDSLKRAVLYSEILGKPKGLQGL